MKIFSYIFFIFIAIFLISCNENNKKIRDASLVPIEQNTPVIIKDREVVPKKSDIKSYILSDIDSNDLNISFDDNNMTIDHIEQPIVLINFFATWSPPCRAELPELDKLQKRYAKQLFVMGILVNDEQESTQFRYFMRKLDIEYFISISKENKSFTDFLIKSLKLPDNFSIPLSLLYINGKYYRFYEGAMPIEMLEYEIKQAIKQAIKQL